MNWTEWNGGKRPVDAEEVVHLRFRDGVDTQKQGMPVMAGWYSWTKRSNERPDGIVAYYPLRSEQERLQSEWRDRNSMTVAPVSFEEWFRSRKFKAATTEDFDRLRGSVMGVK